MPAPQKKGVGESSASESVDEVLEPIVVPVAEQDGNDVETAGGVTEGIFHQVASGDFPDLPLLAGGHGFLRTAEGFVGPGLDLDEDERAAVPGDDVDLAAEHAEAPGDDGIFFLLQKGAGDLFAPQTQGLSAALAVVHGLRLRPFVHSVSWELCFFPENAILGVLEQDPPAEKVFADGIGQGVILL